MVQPNDVLITVQKFDVEAKQIIVNPNELPLEKYRDELEKIKNRHINTFGNSIIEKAFIGSFNNFYNHIFRAIYKWIYAIDNILLEEEFDEIVFTDYTQDIGYMPYYEAEGEINGKLLYKDFDFIPALIFDSLKEYKQNVRFLKVHSVKSLKLRIFSRRYLLLVFKFFLMLRNLILYKIKNSNKTTAVSDSDLNYIFLSRGVAHTQYFLPFLNKNKNSLLHGADGIKSQSKNKNYIETLPCASLYYLKYVSFRDLFSVFFDVLCSLWLTRSIEKISFLGKSFEMRSAIREMIIGYYEVEIYERSLRKMLKVVPNKNEFVIVTGEMLTPYAYAVGYVCKELGFKSIQLQTSLIDYWPQTNFTHCDKFVFTSYQALKTFEHLNPDEAEKYLFWGLLSENNAFSEKSEIKNILYFTQPYENVNEVLIVRKLVELSKKNKITLKVKLHPRDSKDKFSEMSKFLKLEERKNIVEYIEEYDLVVVRTSAIGKEAVIYGVPTIIVLLSNQDQSISVDFILPVYKKYGCFVNSLESMEKAIRDFKFTQKEFVKYREQFFKENKLEMDYSVFLKNISEFKCLT